MAYHVGTVQPVGLMPRTGILAGIRVALVAAVARPAASYVTVLNQDSLAIGQLPVTAAVTQDLCFFVSARRGMLAADFDRPDDAGPAVLLCGFLSRHGLQPVLVASGRPGHRHVFCKVPAALWTCASREAKRLGADVRESIRPPLTAHRLGLDVQLLRPTDPQRAIWWLRGRHGGTPPALDHQQGLDHQESLDHQQGLDQERGPHALGNLVAEYTTAMHRERTATRQGTQDDLDYPSAPSA
ncbi:MAG: hypothetical protein WBV37_11555 [Nocardioidaceae bacterium]